MAKIVVVKLVSENFFFFKTDEGMSSSVVLLTSLSCVCLQIVNLAFPGEPVEVEQQLLNKRLKTLTAYFGELVNADF